MPGNRLVCTAGNASATAERKRLPDRRCCKQEKQKAAAAASRRLIDGTSVTMLEARKNRLNANNTSGYTGVHRDRKQGKWIAQICFKGKTYYLGSFSRQQDAIRARRRGEEMHNEFLRWYYANHPGPQTASDAG